MVIVYRCTTPDGREYVTTDPTLARKHGHVVVPTTIDQVRAAWRAKTRARTLGMAYVEAPSLWSASVPDKRKEPKPLFDEKRTGR